jgi:hypothetical protein
MSNQANFQSASMELLKRLKSRKETIQAKYTFDLSEIDKEIDAVSITLRLLRETAGSTEDVEEAAPAVIPNDLSGKSTREACIEIAKSNGGVVFINDAKRALIAAGILKPSKNTWGIIYTTLIRSKEFEKTDVAGGFRLVQNTSENPQASFLQ